MVIAAGALLLAGIATVVVLRTRFRQIYEPMDGPDMVYKVTVDQIEHVENDNVNGGMYRITATRGATIHIIAERKADADAEPVVTETDADIELFDRIGDIIRKAGLERAGYYPERDPYRLPDVTSHLKVTEPYHVFSITSLMELSDAEQEAWNEIVALLEQSFS